jgi:hypothetical protein
MLLTHTSEKCIDLEDVVTLSDRDSCIVDGKAPIEARFAADSSADTSSMHPGKVDIGLVGMISI